MVSMRAPPCLKEISLCSLSRLSSRGSTPLDVYYDYWGFGHDGITNILLHQTKPRTRSSSHSFKPSPRSSYHCSYTSNFILHLQVITSNFRQFPGHCLGYFT
ncbi:101aa long hypothetical protein [Pyrococcus horikoshii OT3]|uniref:Uncharacterized protein n=1 Tax=Pyrococcus horikoshii (strain ATCC 700860 / DSM 12428 / JCM 9974 / NBRC 100139 / OT-3) TaxID=70601 RepID=O59335_PYRHO|nr:101aa long hypothetical protein [Pyrococcus horikoshii OT3]